MSVFPGAGATVYRNEAGEPTGWSYENDYEPDYDYEREREIDDRSADLAEIAFDEIYGERPDLEVGTPEFEKLVDDRYRRLWTAEKNGDRE